MKYSEITAEYLDEKYPPVMYKGFGVVYKQYIRSPIIAYAMNSVIFANEEVDENVIKAVMNIFNSLFNYKRIVTQSTDDDIENVNKEIVECEKKRTKIATYKQDWLRSTGIDTMSIMLKYVPDIIHSNVKTIYYRVIDCISD